MAHRPPDRPRQGPRSGAKPGATREQIVRRERFERARRETLKPAAEDTVVLYGWHTVTAALKNPGREIRKLIATEMGPGDAIHVVPPTVHRMTAIEETDVFEVSTPETDDVVRLEDRYGRKGT